MESLISASQIYKKWSVCFWRVRVPSAPSS